MLNVPGEAELLGHGLSTCATCDGFFFRGLPIAVIGGGDSALEEAIFLSRFASSVIVIHRRKELRASKIMQDRAMANEKISFIWDSVVTEVLGEDKVSGIEVRDVITGTTTTVELDGVFVAIGHTPNTWLFVDQLDLDPAGYILTGHGTTTNIPGVFACGDVQDHVTVKPSPQQGRAVWRLSTSSGTSRQPPASDRTTSVGNVVRKVSVLPTRRIDKRAGRPFRKERHGNTHRGNRRAPLDLLSTGGVLLAAPYTWRAAGCLAGRAGGWLSASSLVRC